MKTTMRIFRLAMLYKVRARAELGLVSLPNVGSFCLVLRDLGEPKLRDMSNLLNS